MSICMGCGEDHSVFYSNGCDAYLRPYRNKISDLKTELAKAKEELIEKEKSLVYFKDLAGRFKFEQSELLLTKAEAVKMRAALEIISRETSNFTESTAIELGAFVHRISSQAISYSGSSLLDAVREAMETLTFICDSDLHPEDECEGQSFWGVCCVRSRKARACLQKEI